MADIFKKKTTVTDPNTGEKVARYSKKWWGRYRDENDRLRRVSLSTSKTAAQKMLMDILERVERRRAGLEDPVEAASRKPIELYLPEFENHLKAKGVTARHIHETRQKVGAIIEFCRWRTITEITATDVEGYLTDLREKRGRSIQTSNHYLKAIKTFVNWLDRNDQLRKNPLRGLSKLNVQTDRRHDRRPLSIEECARLLAACENGPPVCGLIGPDRAILYLLAGWTGFRRGELGSLTPASFQFEDKQPTVVVEASFSKHRRRDVQPLHRDIAARIQAWIEQREFEPDEILFPISEATCGTTRDTAEMIKRDLKTARRAWIAEATTKKEQQQREQSDFLRYQDSKGRFADFHALRHTFITNLARADVSPKTAQTLARHSDIRLTMEVYTHVEQQQQVEAIEALPAFGLG